MVLKHISMLYRISCTIFVDMLNNTRKHPRQTMSRVRELGVGVGVGAANLMVFTESRAMVSFTSQ